ncbi:hypothetical protein GAYE_SCF22MG4228 [Galdieria yellowstonensis]|uniref:Uncharacterized protein n=1 Tax=Galdieria yellowstonensis TaxID=3028027 RepID=A0AAV9IFY1_9RHOD|nr:hypothetical protein GAYE_SCF22MG4228 [Galdieria yellowstonensis]
METLVTHGETQIDIRERVQICIQVAAALWSKTM